MTKKCMKSWPYLLLLLSLGCYDLPELEEMGTGIDSKRSSTDEPDSETDTDPDTETETDRVCSDQIFCYEGRPENSCVDDQKIRVYRRGTCNNYDECIYPFDDFECNGEGGCDQGICRGDPCQGVICNKPPQPNCADDGLGLEHWSGNAPCIPETGKCNYEKTTSPCGSGTRCIHDRCENSPCTGLQVYCDLQRPASYCDGDTLIEFKQPDGWCERGECVYGVCEGRECIPGEPTKTICESGCDQGLCIEADTQDSRKNNYRFWQRHHQF